MQPPCVPGSGPLRSLFLLVFLAAPGWAESLTLQDAIETALEQNLSLHIERLNITSSFADYELARSEFDPVATAEGSYADTRAPVASSALEGAERPEFDNGRISASLQQRLPFGTDLTLRSLLFERNETNSQFSLINPEYASSLALEVRQPLLKGAGRDSNLATLRIAKLNIAQSNLALQAQALEVMRQTEMAYWLIVTADKAVEIRERSVTLSGRILEEVQARASVEQATRIDVLEAEAGLAERNELLLDAQRERENALDRLYLVMGVLDADAEVPDPAPSLDPLPGIPPEPQDAAASFARALVFAPSYLLQKNREYERDIALRAAHQDRLPNLDVVALGGISGRGSDYRESADGSAKADGNFWQIGLEFRIPWGSRAERARLERARIELERERVSTGQFKQALYADIRAAARDVDLAALRLRSTQISYELNQKKYEEQKFRRDRQQSTIRDVLEAQEEADEAELRHLRARYEALLAVTLLAQFEGTLPERYRVTLTDAEEETLPSE